MEITPAIYSNLDNDLAFTDALQALDAELQNSDFGISSLQQLIQLAAKQLPVYHKILSKHLPHLQQLKGQNGDSLAAQVAVPLQQVMSILNQLSEQDLLQLEWLAKECGSTNVINRPATRDNSAPFPETKSLSLTTQSEIS